MSDSVQQLHGSGATRYNGLQLPQNEVRYTMPNGLPRFLLIAGKCCSCVRDEFWLNVSFNTIDFRYKSHTSTRLSKLKIAPKYENRLQNMKEGKY